MMRDEKDIPAKPQESKKEVVIQEPSYAEIAALCRKAGNEELADVYTLLAEKHSHEEVMDASYRAVILSARVAAASFLKAGKIELAKAYTKLAAAYVEKAGCLKLAAVCKEVAAASVKDEQDPRFVAVYAELAKHHEAMEQINERERARQREKDREKYTQLAETEEKLREEESKVIKPEPSLEQKQDEKNKNLSWGSSVKDRETLRAADHFLWFKPLQAKVNLPPAGESKRSSKVVDQKEVKEFETELVSRIKTP